MIRNMFNTLKISTLLFPVILITVSAPAFSSFRYEKIEKRVISLKGAEGLSILASSSDISVSADPEIDEIFLSIKRKVKAENEEKAEEIARMMDLKVIRKNGLIVLETKYPDRKSVSGNIFSLVFGLGSDISMDLELRVPESLGVALMTASGDIELSDILTDAKISTASGDIAAGNIKGALKVNVASGDVKAENVSDIVVNSTSGDVIIKKSGSAVISVTSGDVTLNDIAGDLAVSTISGDISAENIKGNALARGSIGSIDLLLVKGSVEASCASGDIFITANPDSVADYDLGASSGSINLKFEKILGGGFMLMANTTSGNIKIDLPLNVSNVSRNNIAGVVRDGYSKVIIETSSGDISIEE